MKKKNNFSMVHLSQYNTRNNNTNQAYIFQRPNGTYYSSPTNSNAFTEDVTPVLKRNLFNPATWDFVGSNTNNKYTTQYTDDQLRQMAQDSMPNAEMIPWIDRAGNKQRSARIIGLSPADPIGSTVVEFAGGLPAWKALDYAGNKLAIDFARDFAFTKFGNWTRNKILSNQLNKNIENAALSTSYPHASNVLNIMPKRSNGRYQFDSPTYQVYTGPKHDISEIINADGSVNLRNLLNVQNEALQNVPGGTIVYPNQKPDGSFDHGKSGIHINPANRGKFNATKKRTGKTTEELSHSKNPLTRKRAQFALNARKWKH